MALGAGERKQRYKLVVRVHSAEQLQHSSSQGAYCKLYLGTKAMTEGSYKALTKKDSNDSATSSEETDEPWQLEVRRTRTQHQQPNVLAPPETIWGEVFEIPVRAGRELSSQILSVRVKSQHRFFCPVIGACAVSLANLLPEEKLEQWFPLQKGKKPAGRIRVMLMIAPEDKVIPGLVAKRRQPNEDVLLARAANHEADEAIRRLVEKQLRQEAERRQRRLERTSSGPPVEVKWKKQHELAREDRQKRGENATWPPSQETSELSSIALSTLQKESNQELESPIPPLPVSPLSEYEKRLDKKLRQVRKETARLRKLKIELKKYIPDLQMDSDSEDSLESDEEPVTKMLASSPVFEGRQLKGNCPDEPKHLHVKIEKTVTRNAFKAYNQDTAIAF